MIFRITPFLSSFVFVLQKREKRSCKTSHSLKLSRILHSLLPLFWKENRSQTMNLPAVFPFHSRFPVPPLAFFLFQSSLLLIFSLSLFLSHIRCSTFSSNFFFHFHSNTFLHTAFASIEPLIKCYVKKSLKETVTFFGMNEMWNWEYIF